MSEKEMNEKSRERPWLDAVEEVKFVKGIPGKTSDRWSVKPDLAPCWKGDYREWHIEDGRHYQEQLFCGFWKMFINPSGFTCECCKAGTLPQQREGRAIAPEPKPKTAVNALPDCSLRGEKIGDRECSTCNPELKVRLDVFKCPHHPEGATWLDCRICAVPGGRTRYG